MTDLPPWAKGPFELLVHAESHLLGGEDFDRRIALISFDNTIEVAITTYLTLNPIQRGNRNYAKADTEKWLNNYYTKLDFFEEEVATRGLAWEVEKSHILWAHDQRNEQYHGGQKGTPEKHVLALIRKAALWVFSVLYDVSDAEQRLTQAIEEALPKPAPQHDDEYDRVIDRTYGMLDVCENSYYSSEILFAVDHSAYREIGERLIAMQQEQRDIDTQEKE